MTDESDQDDRLILVREDLVLQGRNPDWRTAWLGGLGPEDRREVWQAVKHGRRVSDSRLAPFVFGIGARWRRWIWVIPVVGLFHLALVAVWIYVSCVVHSESLFYRFMCAFYGLIALVWLIGVPLFLRHRYRRLRHAEEANRELLPT